MFESKEAVRGRLIGPKTWDRIIGKILDPLSLPSLGTAVGLMNCENCEINCALIGMRQEMVGKCGFTK